MSKIQAFGRNGLTELKQSIKEFIHQAVFSQQNWGKTHVTGGAEVVLDRARLPVNAFDFEAIKCSVEDEAVTIGEAELMARIVRFYIPFTGETREINTFEYRPTIAKKSDPSFEIEIKHQAYLGSHLVFQYVSQDIENPADVRKQFKGDLAAFKAQLELLYHEVENFNDEIGFYLKSEIAKKEEMENNIKAYSALLGYPAVNRF